MGCNNNYLQGDYYSDNCVADIVRRIVKAQHEATEVMEDRCITGCDQSIHDLLSPLGDAHRRPRFNTIPFLLYCKEQCKPFVGTGVMRGRHSGHHRFKCVESMIFRAKSFVGNGTCVRLELLEPVHHHGGGGGAMPGGEENINYSQPQSSCGCQSGCKMFEHHVENFRATGICITVDLNCFCGITCLDPITPLRAADRFEDC